MNERQQKAAQQMQAQAGQPVGSPEQQAQMNQGQAQQPAGTSGGLPREITQAGWDYNRINEVHQRFGLDIQKIIALIQKYGPIVLKIIEELLGHQPPAPNPAPTP